MAWVRPPPQRRSRLRHRRLRLRARGLRRRSMAWICLRRSVRAGPLPTRMTWGWTSLRRRPSRGVRWISGWTCPRRSGPRRRRHRMTWGWTCPRRSGPRRRRHRMISGWTCPRRSGLRRRRRRMTWGWTCPRRSGLRRRRRRMTWGWTCPRRSGPRRRRRRMTWGWTCPRRRRPRPPGWTWGWTCLRRRRPRPPGWTWGWTCLRQRRPRPWGWILGWTCPRRRRPRQRIWTSGWTFPRHAPRAAEVGWTSTFPRHAPRAAEVGWTSTFPRHAPRAAEVGWTWTFPRHAPRAAEVGWTSTFPRPSRPWRTCRRRARRWRTCRRRARRWRTCRRHARRWRTCLRRRGRTCPRPRPAPGPRLRSTRSIPIPRPQGVSCSDRSRALRTFSGTLVSWIWAAHRLASTASRRQPLARLAPLPLATASAAWTSGQPPRRARPPRPTSAWPRRALVVVDRRRSSRSSTRVAWATSTTWTSWRCPRRGVAPQRPELRRVGWAMAMWIWVATTALASSSMGSRWTTSRSRASPRDRRVMRWSLRRVIGSARSRPSRPLPRRRPRSAATRCWARWRWSCCSSPEAAPRSRRPSMACSVSTPSSPTCPRQAIRRGCATPSKRPSSSRPTTPTRARARRCARWPPTAAPRASAAS
jgi:hypothetical protein